MPRKNGFTLIETLIASAVLVIFITAVMSIIQMITQSLGEARVRSLAIQLAQDRIELSHNLEYEQIGTVDGVPHGPLLPIETVESQGSSFEVRTSVLFIDDVYDGTAPDDVFPADYKRVRVAVTWQGVFASKKPVVLMTNISPPGLETDVGGGTLSILVFNALGVPVENALVQIESINLNPQVTIEAYTDVNGTVSVPGTPVCVSCYTINVSKDGYSSDRTYGTEEVANPAKPHISIIEGRVSEISFAIDVLSSLTLRATRSRTSSYSVFPGANLIVTGTKEIGKTADDEPVFKVSQSVTTGAGGLVTLAGLEWDRYTISVPSNASIDLGGSWPFNPIPVNPGETSQATVIVVAATDNNLLVQLEDSRGQPLTLAIVEISRPDYIATGSSGAVNTGDYSQVFFPGLEANIYDVVMSSTGYETATASVMLDGERVEKFILSNP